MLLPVSPAVMEILRQLWRCRLYFGSLKKANETCRWVAYVDFDSHRCYFVVMWIMHFVAYCIGQMRDKMVVRNADRMVTVRFEIECVVGHSEGSRPNDDSLKLWEQSRRKEEKERKQNKKEFGGQRFRMERKTTVLKPGVKYGATYKH